MDLTRNQFLTGSVLTQDQDICVGGRGAADRLEHSQRGRRCADHSGLNVCGGRQAAIAVAQFRRLDA